jgi:hypothetical protein
LVPEADDIRLGQSLDAWAPVLAAIGLVFEALPPGRLGGWKGCRMRL